MEHVVFFPTSEGAPAFRRVASLAEAAGLVEHLRNVEGVTEVSVHALTEVPLAFRAWYRVELPAAGLVPEQPAQPTFETVAGEVADLPAPHAMAEVVGEPFAVDAAHAARRDLGFFAS